MTLFEYGDWHSVHNEKTLKHLLQDTWGQRPFENDDEPEAEEQRYQPFLQFDGNQIRAKNYTGFIQFEDTVIEIYPKVFKGSTAKTTDKTLMLRHIFYWFNYCRKWRFPFQRATLGHTSIDSLPELIIHLIANQMFELVSEQPLMQYQFMEEAMMTPRGRINFNRYANNSLSKGNFHQIECDYEPFVYDNKVNRIIKYCARLLLGQTRFGENVRLLQEVVFILDEVEDRICTEHDIASVALNNFHEAYSTMLETAKLIIGQRLYSNNNYDLSQWCLLFPMEYIFEDFVAGFLETHFSDTWKVKYQDSKDFLSNTPEAFKMQHDIFLEARKGPKRIVIVDTKYKLRGANFKQDKKKGIVQSDLYQVVSYAYKRGCDEVFLLYPNVDEFLQAPDTFTIKSGFEDQKTIQVTAMEIPFWSLRDFDGIEQNLIKQLKNI